MGVEIRPATPEHAQALGFRLRPRDLAEVEAAGGHPVRDILTGMERSVWARTALVDGEVAAMWGVVSLGVLNPIAVVWLLTGPEFETISRRWLLRTVRMELAEMQCRFPLLTTLVHSRHEQAIRFVRHLGFAVSPTIAAGRIGETFHPIWRAA